MLQSDTTSKANIIIALRNDSSRLTNDSINYLSSINSLKLDTTSKANIIISLQNQLDMKISDIGKYQDSVNHLNDTIINRNNTIISLQSQLSNKNSIISLLKSKFGTYLSDTISNILYENITINITNTGINTNPNQQNNKITLSVYPNPTSDVIHVVLENPNSYPYEIYDISGKKMTNGNINGTDIDLSNLPFGTYFLKINIDNTISTNKIQVIK